MLPTYPANYAHDVYGNAPPDFGGPVAEMHVVFNKTAGPTTAFALPAGAQIIGFDLTVNTIFDGSATLSVGHSGSNGYYLNAQSVLDTAGPVFSTAWLTNGKWFTTLPSGDTITITIGGSPTVGAAVLTCRYVLRPS